MFYVFENRSAFVIVSNPRNGPSGSFSCIQNVVHLGAKSLPAPKELLAQAMLVYGAGKTIRFGIRGKRHMRDGIYRGGVRSFIF